MASTGLGSGNISDQDEKSHSSYGTCFLSEEEENTEVKKNINKQKPKPSMLQATKDINGEDTSESATVTVPIS